MIRKMEQKDLDAVMEIWLTVNMKAHDFIAPEYWESNVQLVRRMMPEAAVYVYEEEGQIGGFIGLLDNYIAGIFVKEEMQSRGIGKQLLNYAKKKRDQMRLQVYRNNMRAIRFYEREGFVIQKCQMDQETQEEELVMVWKDML